MSKKKAKAKKAQDTVQRAQLWRDGIVLAFAGGASVKRACRAVKIGLTTYYGAFHADPEFAARVTSAVRSYRVSLGAMARSKAMRLLEGADGRALDADLVRLLEVCLREAARGEPKQVDVDHSHAGNVTVTVEQKMQAAEKRWQELLAEVRNPERISVYLKSLDAQHESAKAAGGNGGNGGNGHGGNGSGGNGHGRAGGN